MSPVFTPPAIPVVPPVSIADGKYAPPTQDANRAGYNLMKYYYNTNSSFRRYRGVNVWKMKDGTYMMSDPVPGVPFTGTISYPYPDTLEPVNNAISSSWFAGGAPALGPNLLSAQDSGFESGGTGTWTALNNCTAVRQFGVAQSGVAALDIFSTNPGDMSVGTGTNVYAATPGAMYGASAWRLGVNAQAPCLVSLAWLTAGAAAISTTTGAAALDNSVPNPFAAPAGAWVLTSVTGAVAPAGTAFAQVVLTTLNTQNALEAHYADNVRLFTMTPTSGSGPGGLQQLVSPGIAVEYLGGHSYTVTAAEATALTTAGLGAFLT